MKKHNLLVAIVAVVECIAFTAQPVQAAKYSKSEAKQVKYFQRKYKNLDKAQYNRNSIYQQTPNFANPFSPGVLNPAYISTTMDYVNYYRDLVGLPSELILMTLTVAPDRCCILAAVNASASLQAHGLINYLRPNYISENDWGIARTLR